MEKVEGAFLVRNVLSTAECQALLGAVRELCDTDPKAKWRTAARGVESVRRRDSQHHTPCRVLPNDMAPLCHRLRPWLPPTAGPRNACKLEDPSMEVSTFLRCYDYRKGDASAPHFDRTYVEKAPKEGPMCEGATASVTSDAESCRSGDKEVAAARKGRGAAVVSC